MPYAIQNPTDGKFPSWRAVGEGEDLEADEVLVNEAPVPGEVWDAATQSFRDPTTTEALTEARAAKERELRDAADGWYQANVRSFEGAVVLHKIDRGQVLSVEEQAVRDQMSSNYTKLKNLIVQTRAATTLSEVEAIQWT
jgi:hypothetical protein